MFRHCRNFSFSLSKMSTCGIRPRQMGGTLAGPIIQMLSFVRQINVTAAVLSPVGY
jgi:hypothetical protein